MGVALAAVPVSNDPDDVVTPERAEVGRRLRTARIRAGLKVKPASRLAGVSDQLWHQAENGWKRLGSGVFTVATTKPENLAAMARAVDLDPDELLEPLGHLTGFASAGGAMPGDVGAPSEDVAHVTRRRPVGAEDLIDVDGLTNDQLLALIGQASAKLSERAGEE